MSSLFPSWARMPGSFVVVQSAPQTCPVCGDKLFYKQADFRQGIGLWLVGIASALTVVLSVMGFGWFWIWSPMFAFLIFDRVLAYLTPLAVICYHCDTVFRGLNKPTAETYPDFDLEVHDRVKYSERVAGQADA